MDRPVANRVVLDTNVLLTATDEGRAGHADALGTLDVWPGLGVTLYTSGQIAREYLSVATRAADQNGLGLPMTSALENVRALMGRMHLLAEDRKVASRLLELLGAVDCSGKQVHDANVVATMLVHGITTIVTGNVGDFERFGNQIIVVGLGPSSS